MLHNAGILKDGLCTPAQRCYIPADERLKLDQESCFIIMGMLARHNDTDHMDFSVWRAANEHAFLNAWHHEAHYVRTCSLTFETEQVP